MSMICPESMARMGKRQVPSIEGEIPHQAWADPDIPTPPGSFRSKKPVEDSDHLLANTSTYCLCTHESPAPTAGSETRRVLPEASGGIDCAYEMVVAN